MTIESYYPEMGHKPTEGAQILARYSAYGNKYTVKTLLNLTGQGITFNRTYRSEDLVPEAQHRVGWHQYTVTPKALKRIGQQYNVAIEILLD